VVGSSEQASLNDGARSLHFDDIVLASASPRRTELLKHVFADFRVVPSSFDESLVPPDLGPGEHVVYSATMKARDVAESNPVSLVIAADTVVAIDGAILGKPTDSLDAARMLRLLSGKTHQVYTGLAVIGAGVERVEYEATDVAFRDLSDETVSRYVASGEPLDKAGAYAIQGRGSVLITGIRGCYFNVVGLPIHRLSVVLEGFGYRPLASF